MNQKYVVITDYKHSGLHCYPFYLYENALSSYQSHVENDGDVLVSVALMQVDDDANFVTLMSKYWR